MSTNDNNTGSMTKLKTSASIRDLSNNYYLRIIKKSYYGICNFSKPSYEPPVKHAQLRIHAHFKP